MTAIDLRQKNWLIPFLRAVRGGTDKAQSAAAVDAHQGKSPQEAFTAWATASLRERGLWHGTLQPRWPLPGGASEAASDTAWTFLNLLTHQTELLAEQRQLLGKTGDTTCDQLEMLAVFAAAHGAEEAADSFWDLALDDWPEDDTSKKRLAKQLTAPAARLGALLREAYLHASDQPLLGLPFHQVLTYVDTRLLLEVGWLYVAGGQRPDPGQVASTLAHHHLQKLHLIEAVIALANADDTITKLERRLIDTVIEMARLPAEETAMLNEAAKHPPSPAELASQLQEAQTRRFLYTQLELNALLSGEDNPAERRFLDVLADAFELAEGEGLALQGDALVYLEEHPDVVETLSLNDTLRRFKRRLSLKAEDAVKGNMDRLVTEIRETGELAALLSKRARGKLSADEEKKVKEQLTDICKTVPSLALFAVPGGSLLLPIMIKVLPFNLLPTAFTTEDEGL